MIFAASLLIAHSLGLKAYAAILWIPIFLLCLRFLPFMIFALFPGLMMAKGPPTKAGWRRNLSLFLGIWSTLTLFNIAYGFILGWGAFLTGSSEQEIREISDFWSVPLGWANPAFIVRPEKGFVAVFGIVAANTYFYALAITLIFKIVHGIMRRSRVIELGLTHRTIDEDDDQL